MAQRASGFSKRLAGNTRAAERARSADAGGEPIPLDLAGLVAPYRRHRAISIRVERLAHGARLSQGRNNGDRSWSLAVDEIDGLQYQPPSDAYDAHTLAVRIISLDGGDAETLAVIDLPIPARGNSATLSSIPSAALGGEVQRLRDELVKVKSTLAVRETDMAKLQRQAEDAERARQTLKAEFSGAEEAWDRELRRQLAAAATEAEASVARARADWEAEAANRTSRSEAGAQRVVEDARRRWQQEHQAALAKAQAEWKAAETARLSTAEATWRAQAEKQLADFRDRLLRAEAALSQARVNGTVQNKNAQPGDEAQLQALRQQLAQAQASLAARDEEIAAVQAKLQSRETNVLELQSKAERALANSRESAARLAKAEREWQTAESKRMAAAEATWREDSSQALAEIHHRLQHSEAALAEARAQAEARQHQLMALQGSLAARERELTQMRAAAEQSRSQATKDAESAREHWQGEIRAALAKAQEGFRSGEAARLSAAEAKWKAQFASAVAETAAQIEKAETALASANEELQSHRTQSAEQVRKLRDELSRSQTELAARNSEVADVRSALEQARATADESLTNVAAEIEKARQKWKREADAALAKAEKKWRAEEAPRLAAAEARWQEQVAVQLTEAQERAQRAETGAAEARACSEGLRHELMAVQASLANREVELAEARAVLEQERERQSQAPLSSVQRKSAWELEEEARRASFRRRLIRDGAILACLFAMAFMLIPRVEPVVADVWPQNLSSLKTGFQPLLQMAGLSSRVVPVVALPPDEPRSIVNVRMANMRETPSANATVVGKLARNVELTPLERRGKWVFVRIGEGAEQKQGWVSAGVLKDLSVTGPEQR